MPLPAADVSRQRTFTRTIAVEGWRREDGLWDVEARLTDVRDFDSNLASGLRRKGEALHDMWVRLTIDRQMTIHAAAVSSDAVPYPGSCESIAPAYQQLVGLSLFKGFRRKVTELYGKVKGCTHITELLGIMPTAAIQTFASSKRENEERPDGKKPFQLDQCHALETTSETVQRFYPRWFRSNKTGT